MTMETMKQSNASPGGLKFGRTEIVRTECADGHTAVLEIESGTLHDSPDEAKAEPAPIISLRNGALTLDGASADPARIRGAEGSREGIVAITGRSARLDFYLLKEA